jgi:iron complex transport system permease protein
MTRGAGVIAGCGLVLALAMAASLLIGRTWLPPADVWHALTMPGVQLSDLIVMELRLPRAVLAVLVGAALGLSGAALQGLLRNPLADPGLLGVSGGAALGAVIAIYFGLASAFALATPLCGLAGALAAGALTFAFGRGGGTLSLILAGAAVSSLMGAGVALALNFAPNLFAVFEITIWLMGSLADRSWDHVLLAGPFILLGCGLLLTTGRAIDALALGEAQAASLGVRLERVQLQVLLGAGLAVGAATSVTGAIGFIGLVAPHLVRPLVGHQPRRTLVPSALAGAALVLAADVATRVIRVSSDIRLGVLTSLIGLPFFFWLVLKLKRTAP